MLAALTDLVAIGAIPDGTSALERYGARGTRLLQLASGQVCAYLGTTEALLLAEITVEQTTALAAIVAECAGARLNVSAAPSTDPYAMSGQPMSVMLNRWHKSQIDELIRLAGQGSRSVINARDADSSLLVLTVTQAELVAGEAYFDSGTWYPVG